MKVFISWSGESSHQVACVWRDWLPKVIQRVKPYVSSKDIDKGARWVPDIASELDTTSVGIICVTPDNKDEPWLNFEAGALSKTSSVSRLPVLGIGPVEVTGPLVQFQFTKYYKDDIYQLVQTVNLMDEAGHRLADEQLKETLVYGGPSSKLRWMQ